MEQEQAQIEWVERYLENRLTQKEKAEFELQLNEDVEFQKFFTEMKLIIAGINSSARNDLLVKLKKTESNLKAGKKARTISMKRYLLPVAVAAGLAVLISLSVLFSRNSAEKQLDNYLAMAVEPYQNIIHPTQRSQENKRTTEEMAYYYYDAQEYVIAIQIFSTLELTDEEEQNANFYLANAYMGNGNFEQAIEKFTNLLQQKTLFENQTRWYMSLCMLKEGQEESAQNQLRILTQTENSYKVKAEKLLKQMK